MNSNDIDLDSAAMRAWLQSEEMQNMLEGYARRQFGKDYDVKVMGSRAIVTSGKKDGQSMLKDLKGKGNHK